MTFPNRGFLLYVTVVSAVAGFLYGYNSGIISGAPPHIRAAGRFAPGYRRLADRTGAAAS